MLSLAAIFFCLIVFGIYGIVLESRSRAGVPTMPELPDLNPVIHGKLRLALLSLLTGVERPSLPGCVQKPARRTAIWARNC